MRESATTLAPEIDAAELAMLLSHLRANRLSGLHLEIGTAAGGTLKEMMLCYLPGQRPRFVVVDPMTYFPNQLSIVQQNLSSAGIDPAEIDFRVTRSWPAFLNAQRANETYSFMFIDAGHKIHHVTDDLAWTRLLQSGGLVCLHNYEPRFKGVVAAVDRFLHQHRNYDLIARENRLVVIRKTSLSDTQEISRWDRIYARAVNILHQIEAAFSKRIRGFRNRGNVRA